MPARLCSMARASARIWRSKLAPSIPSWQVWSWIHRFRIRRARSSTMRVREWFRRACSCETDTTLTRRPQRCACRCCGSSIRMQQTQPKIRRLTTESRRRKMIVWLNPTGDMYKQTEDALGRWLDGLRADGSLNLRQPSNTIEHLAHDVAMQRLDLVAGFAKPLA